MYWCVLAVLGNAPRCWPWPSGFLLALCTACKGRDGGMWSDVVAGWKMEGAEAGVASATEDVSSRIIEEPAVADAAPTVEQDLVAEPDESKTAASAEDREGAVPKPASVLPPEASSASSTTSGGPSEPSASGDNSAPPANFSKGNKSKGKGKAKMEAPKPKPLPWEVPAEGASTRTPLSDD